MYLLLLFSLAIVSLLEGNSETGLSISGKTWTTPKIFVIRLGHKYSLEDNYFESWQVRNPEKPKNKSCEAKTLTHPIPSFLPGNSRPEWRDY